MKPEVSQDLVKVFTLKIAETILTLESTSASRRLKMYPRKDLSSAACRNVIRTITKASCTSGNLTMLRIGAVRSLIMPMIAPHTMLGHGRSGRPLVRCLDHAEELASLPDGRDAPA